MNLRLFTLSAGTLGAQRAAITDPKQGTGEPDERKVRVRFGRAVAKAPTASVGNSAAAYSNNKLYTTDELVTVLEAHGKDDCETLPSHASQTTMLSVR